MNGPLRREYLRQYEIEDLFARAERVFLDLGGIPVDGGNIVTVSNAQSQAIKVEGVRTRVTSRKVLKDGALVTDAAGGNDLSVVFDLSRGASEGIVACNALPGCDLATPDPFDAEQRRKGYFAAHSINVAPNTSFSFYTQFHGDGSGHTIELVTWYLEVDVLALDTRGARQRQSLVVRDPKTNRDFTAAIANFVSPPCPLYSLDQDTATLVKAA